MPKNSLEYRKLGALLLLGAICAALVYRNLLHPGDAGRATSLPLAGTSPQATASDRNPRSAVASSGGQQGRRTQTSKAQTGMPLDPTLRLDLLEASRAVKYERGSRNIFQLQLSPSPPPPATPATLPPAPSTGAQLPSAPPAATSINLKFYGVAQRPGNQQKKAFFTDGEEILIGQEGEVVGKFYKIIRIGVNTIELEDTRSQKRQQLPLIEE